MAKKATALSGAIDPTRPRTIKAISDDVWKIITDAATDRRMTVGQFLESHFRTWAADGRPTAVEPTNPVGNPDKPGLQDVARLLDAAREIAAAAGVPVPPGLARDGLALARQQTRAARGLAPAGRKKALAAPE